MAIELEKPELRSIDFNKKRHKVRNRILIAISIFIMIVVATFFIQQYLSKSYTSYKVVHTTVREDSSSAKYISYKEGVIRYSRDGIMAMDSMGNRLWNGTYEMKNPIIDINEEYVVVADNGSKLIQIYNGSKQPTNITVLNNILDVEIASQGVIAVLMESEASNLIEIYSQEGGLLAGMRTTNESDGFPVDMDLSKDGRTLATSYMFFSSGTVQNALTLYSFDKVGQTSYKDQVVGYYDYGSTIIPELKFVNYNTLVAFGDGVIKIYSGETIPKLSSTIEITQEIKSIFYNEEYIGIMGKNNDGEEMNILYVYDLKGNRILNLKNNFEYDSIQMHGKDIIMYNEENVIVVTTEGNIRFQTTFDTTLRYFFPTDKRREFIRIDDLNMDKIKLSDE